MTPAAEAGPGVSSPTPRTASGGVPVSSSTLSSAMAMASMATWGPSVTRLGVSTSRRTKKPLDGSRRVAFLLVPPLSMPTTTLPVLVSISAPLSRLVQVVSGPRRRAGEHRLEDVATAAGQVGQQGGRVVERDQVGDQMLAHRRAGCTQQLDRLGGQAAP